MIGVGQSALNRFIVINGSDVFLVDEDQYVY